MHRGIHKEEHTHVGTRMEGNTRRDHPGGYIGRDTHRIIHTEEHTWRVKHGMTEMERQT